MARMRSIIISASFVIGAVLLLAAKVSMPQGASTSSLPDPQKSEEIKIRFGEASSYLRPQLGNRPKDYFAPRKAFDNDWETCWAEASEGIGIGEWVKLVWLTREVPTHVGVVPGWAKTKARWANNPRLKTADIILSNGYIQTAHFEDRMQLQFVALRSYKPAEWMKLVIKEVYPGKRFEDTSVSEIKVFRGKEP